MPGMHLRQPRFTYSTCGPIRKKKERIQKFKEKRDSRYIAKNLKHDEYQRGLASMVDKLFVSGGAATLANKPAVKNKNMSNEELAEELHI